MKLFTFIAGVLSIVSFGAVQGKNYEAANPFTERFESEFPGVTREYQHYARICVMGRTRSIRMVGGVNMDVDTLKAPFRDFGCRIFVVRDSTREAYFIFEEIDEIEYDHFLFGGVIDVLSELGNTRKVYYSPPNPNPGASADTPYEAYHGTFSDSSSESDSDTPYEAYHCAASDSSSESDPDSYY